jgi:hypothetical protein
LAVETIKAKLGGATLLRQTVPEPTYHFSQVVFHYQFSNTIASAVEGFTENLLT